MGNWRTVNISGQMNPNEARDMISLLSSDMSWDTPAACFGMSRSLCGLNVWVDKITGAISKSGNLAERDYENEDIEQGLKFLAEKYPSLELTLHSGSDYESLQCSATFIVSNGVVKKLEPQIKNLIPIQMTSIYDLLKGE